MLFNIQCASIEKEVSVTNAEGPPVPIPNTEVKLCSGEDTLRETVRENSSMPTQDMGTEKPFPSPENKEKAQTYYGGVAQLGEHLPCKQGVMGSNPIISTIKPNKSLAVLCGFIMGWCMIRRYRVQNLHSKFVSKQASLASLGITIILTKGKHHIGS